MTELTNSGVYDKLNNHKDANPNDNYNILHNVLSDIGAKCMPTKKVKINKHKHKKSKWITQGIIRSITFRDKLYLKMKLSPKDTAEYTTIKINLKTCNNILKRNIRQAMNLYYQHQFDQYKNNIKKTWGVKELVNRRPMTNILPQYFIVDREILRDKHVIANRVNTFFTNICPKLASQIVTDGNSSYEDFLINPTLHEFSFNEIGEEDVVNVIDKLPSKTSNGVDGISTNLLKDIKYLISKPLILIINQCLETGIFPSKLKIAKVIPILKRGDETIFDNYRPISILPSILKVFERIIFNQIHDYFHVNNLYFCSQYGFRKEHSTELAVLELIDRITQHLDKGTTPINVYLHLSKAFDTLDHNILLHKLKYYGIEGTALRLFESYLNERQQYVDFDGTISNNNRILTGVPQGSILGPLLFIIYISDIAQSSKHFNFIIYANDTTLCTTLKINADATQLNMELNNVSQWLNLNKLSLNVKNPKAMAFHMPQKKIIQPDYTNQWV